VLRVVDRTNRIRLGLCGLVICAAAVFFGPLAAAPPAEDPGEVTVREFEGPAPIESPSGQIPALSRDPFAALPKASQTPGIGAIATGSRSTVVRTPEPVQVLAVITGERNRALVAEGGNSRIVSPGDALAGTRGRASDAGAVVLAAGTVLHLADPLRCRRARFF